MVTETGMSVGDLPSNAVFYTIEPRREGGRELTSGFE